MSLAEGLEIPWCLQREKAKAKSKLKYKAISECWIDFCCDVCQLLLDVKRATSMDEKQFSKWLESKRKRQGWKTTAANPKEQSGESLEPKAKKQRRSALS